MQLTTSQIHEVRQIMVDNTNAIFDIAKKKIENPTNMEELKSQFDWLEILDKSKETINLLWEYIGKGAQILFVDGQLFSKKWYNLFGVLKLISVGKVFFDMIIEFYKIWSK